MPITSRSSLRSATICCFSIALRTASEPVAQAGGPLELELGRRRLHLGLEAVDDRVGVAVEELEQLADELAVRHLLDLADARAGALLDVEQQARPAEALVLVELVAGLHVRIGERAQQQVERVADGVGVGVRARSSGCPCACGRASPSPAATASSRVTARNG